VCSFHAQVAEPIEYLRRPERLGLGANPVPVVEDPNKKKVVKMGACICVAGRLPR
jgi:hypothetical protein